VPPKNKLVTETTGIGRPWTLGLVNPEDEYLAELEGLNRYDIYREMGKSDAGLAAMIRTIRWIVTQADWSVVGGEPEVHDFIAAQVEKNIRAHLRIACRLDR